ncbi:hypothetical protein AUJ84_02170 [Candidatus Pacearchaeota archaeon CG1_02_32_132]|nr:MAG: hypothetical protein AUJ84_02170 [Candidatus Pacearchaeota archaeon CG1_02_32_132]
MNLKDKVAVISGISKRFGSSTAYLFAKEGASLVLISRNTELTNKITEDIRFNGGKAISIACDVTKNEEVDKAVEEIKRVYGKVDILFNNAGGKYTKRQKMHEMSSDFWDEVINTNLKSVFVLSSKIIPLMKEGGSIINISAAHKTLLDSNTAYAAAKSGIVGLTRNLARELRESNIRVNCIKPGVIRNDFNSQNLTKYTNKVKRKGNSEDVAFAALHLASDTSSWTTGQTITVDGGEELFSEMENE